MSHLDGPDELDDARAEIERLHDEMGELGDAYEYQRNRVAFLTARQDHRLAACDEFLVEARARELFDASFFPVAPLAMKQVAWRIWVAGAAVAVGLRRAREFYCDALDCEPKGESDERS